MTVLRLIVDFDGVVVDALDECALVTWLGLHPPAPSEPVSAAMTVMPTEFRRRFARVRDFSRTLHHFVVAHRAAAGHIASQAEFDNLYAAITPATVRDFVARASASRQRCREEEAPFWLDLHTLYPGVADLLERHAGSVAIVTAKDEESVWTILRRRGLEHTVVEVVGESSRKDEAVRALCQRFGLTPPQVTFIDDNLSNVCQVSGTGAGARWATWGYHTPEDRAAAGRSGVRPLDLADLPTITV